MRPAQPARRMAIVTCMDARLDPLDALGLELGDAHVLRNAGAMVTDDVLRSLAASREVAGTSAVGDGVLRTRRTGPGRPVAGSSSKVATSPERSCATCSHRPRTRWCRGQLPPLAMSLTGERLVPSGLTCRTLMRLEPRTPT